MTTTDEPRTTAALQARRASADHAVQRVAEALQQMRRERARITVTGVARRADVSRTFLHQNTEARDLVSKASSNAGSGHASERNADQAEAGWRQRALNAEHGLRRAHDEIVLQRTRIGGLLGQVRDLEADLPPDGVQRLLSENHTLKARTHQLEHEVRRLEERLAGARDNNRFLDKRVAHLEAELANWLRPPAAQSGSVTAPRPSTPARPLRTEA